MPELISNIKNNNRALQYDGTIKMNRHIFAGQDEELGFEGYDPRDDEKSLIDGPVYAAKAAWGSLLGLRWKNLTPVNTDEGNNQAFQPFFREIEVFFQAIYTSIENFRKLPASEAKNEVWENFQAAAVKCCRDMFDSIEKFDAQNTTLQDESLRKADPQTKKHSGKTPLYSQQYLKLIEEAFGLKIEHKNDLEKQLNRTLNECAKSKKDPRITRFEQKAVNYEMAKIQQQIRTTPPLSWPAHMPSASDRNSKNSGTFLHESQPAGLVPLANNTDYWRNIPTYSPIIGEPKSAIPTLGLTESKVWAILKDGFTMTFGKSNVPSIPNPSPSLSPISIPAPAPYLSNQPTATQEIDENEDLLIEDQPILPPLAPAIMSRPVLQQNIEEFSLEEHTPAPLQSSSKIQPRRKYWNSNLKSAIAGAAVAIMSMVGARTATTTSNAADFPKPHSEANAADSSIAQEEATNIEQKEQSITIFRFDLKSTKTAAFLNFFNTSEGSKSYAQAFEVVAELLDINAILSPNEQQLLEQKLKNQTTNFTAQDEIRISQIQAKIFQKYLEKGTEVFAEKDENISKFFASHLNEFCRNKSRPSANPKSLNYAFYQAFHQPGILETSASYSIITDPRNNPALRYLYHQTSASPTFQNTIADAMKMLEGKTVKTKTEAKQKIQEAFNSAAAKNGQKKLVDQMLGNNNFRDSLINSIANSLQKTSD